MSSEQSLTVTNPPKKVGRPKAVSDEVVRKLSTWLQQGTDVKTACILSGISTSTYYNELKTNKRFMDIVTVSQNHNSVLANSLVSKAIDDGDLKTARWWIERMDRLERHAQHQAEYRLIKKLTLTKTNTETQTVEIELDTFTD